MRATKNVSDEDGCITAAAETLWQGTTALEESNANLRRLSNEAVENWLLLAPEQASTANHTSLSLT